MIMNLVSAEFLRAYWVICRSPFETLVSLSFMGVLLALMLGGTGLMGAAGIFGGALTGFVLWMTVTGLMAAGASDVQDDAQNHLLGSIALALPPLWGVIAVRVLAHGLTGLVYGLLLAGAAAALLSLRPPLCGSMAVPAATLLIGAFGVGLVTTGAALMAPRARILAGLGAFLLLPVLVFGTGALSRDTAGAAVGSLQAALSCRAEAGMSMWAPALAALWAVAAVFILRLQVDRARKTGALGVSA